MTPGFATSKRIDLNQIGEARNSMLSIKLDQVRALLRWVWFVTMATVTRYPIPYPGRQ